MLILLEPKVISDSPLTVISGHEAARVPAETFDADTIVTQLTPSTTWGKMFLLPSHIGRNNGQSYKVIAANYKANALKTCGTNYTMLNKSNLMKSNINWFYTTKQHIL